MMELTNKMIMIQCPLLWMPSRSIDEGPCNGGHKITSSFLRGPGLNLNLAIPKNTHNSVGKQTQEELDSCNTNYELYYPNASITLLN